MISNTVDVCLCHTYTCVYKKDPYIENYTFVICKCAIEPSFGKSTMHNKPVQIEFVRKCNTLMYSKKFKCDKNS